MITAKQFFNLNKTCDLTLRFVIALEAISSYFAFNIENQLIWLVYIRQEFPSFIEILTNFPVILMYM